VKDGKIEGGERAGIYASRTLVSALSGDARTGDIGFVLGVWDVGDVTRERGEAELSTCLVVTF
jgi:hypothetical protein